MDKQMAFDLAIGMCEKSNVGYDVNHSEHQIRTLIGSAAVFVDIGGSDEQLSYHLWASFVHDIELTDATEWGALRWVNRKNHENWYGRYILVERDEDGRRKGTLVVENEILVADIQQSEFINALTMLWAHANNADDEAVELFGGKTAAEVIAEQRAGSDAENV